MKRFFNWLLGSFKPDSSKYVKNIKNNDSGSEMENSFGQTKRKKKEATVLAWLPIAEMKENVEDNQGTSIDIILKKDSKFSIINTIGNIQVDSVKKGLSMVEHKLAFKAEAKDTEEIKEATSGGSLCFLHRTQEGDFVFLGEEEGLVLIETDDDFLHFKGVESDVFFQVTEECFYKLLTNIEL